MPLAALRLLLPLALVLTLAACAESAGPFALGPFAPGPAAPLPPGASPAFAAAAARIEPVAEALCRQHVRDRSCNFMIAVDGRPDLPANAYQTLDSRGRPWVVFTAALIAEARNADELAFVLGHEMAHHIAGHIPKREIQAREGAMLAGVLATVAGASPEEVREAQSIGAALAAAEYSQEFEFEADAMGAEIAWRAGFDPVRGAAFFARLPDPGALAHGSHPSNARRQALVAQVVAALEAGAG